MILWSLPKVLNQGLGVVIPSTLLTQQRAHLQPNSISRQMGRGGRFCSKANQEGTVWCSLKDCKTRLFYCLLKLLALEKERERKEGNQQSLPAGMLTLWTYWELSTGLHLWDCHFSACLQSNDAGSYTESRADMITSQICLQRLTWHLMNIGMHIQTFCSVIT